MTKRLLIVLAALVATPISAQAQEPLVQSLRGLFDVTKRTIMATAEDLDERMYAYRPTDEVRNAGQILAHIADWHFIFCSAASAESNPHPESFEETATTKPAIMRALQQGFAYCEGVFDRTTDRTAAQPVQFFGGPNTTGGVLAFAAAHNYEHYGNLVTYMRINGIVPPSSR